MSDQPYSQRELNEHFRVINEKLDNLMKEAKRTNGRVSRLEAWRFALGLCITLIGLVVLPLIVYSFNVSVDNVQTQVLYKAQQIFVTKQP